MNTPEEVFNDYRYIFEEYSFEHSFKLILDKYERCSSTAIRYGYSQLVLSILTKRRDIRRNKEPIRTLYINNFPKMGVSNGE